MRNINHHLEKDLHHIEGVVEIIKEDIQNQVDLVQIIEAIEAEEILGVEAGVGVEAIVVGGEEDIQEVEVDLIQEDIEGK